jgi:hypothetical protein
MTTRMIRALLVGALGYLLPGSAGARIEPAIYGQFAERPDAVNPAAFDGARVAAGSIRVTVPARSVIVLSEETQ